jgi:6-phospho-beta-glucosidase
MERAKITVLGGSSVSTPELFYSLSDEESMSNIDEICLYGRNKRKGKIIKRFVQGYLKETKSNIKITFSTNLKESISNSKIILNQIRVGGLKARKEDWKIFRKYNLMCDEATSPGCLGHTIRGVNLFYSIGEAIKEYNPRARVINSTNPGGLFTDVFNKSGANAIGSCDMPIRMINKVKSIAKDKKVTVDYIGINHLSWITNVYKNKRKVTKEIIKSYDYFDKNTRDHLTRVPSPYLRFFLFEEEAREDSLSHERKRIVELMQLEKELLRYYQSATAFSKPKLLEKRGAIWYKLALVPLVESLLKNKPTLNYIDIKNNGLLNSLKKEQSIEVAALVSNKSIEPIIPKNIPSECLVQMNILKEYESKLIEAILGNSKSSAACAVSLHPLIHSLNTSVNLINEFWRKEKPYLKRDKI